jgi:uncharacterized protein (DUF433 family)
MKWQHLIESNPDVLAGKPVVKGTRLSVEFLLSLFAEGWTHAQVLENYPTLDSKALQAVFAFSADCLHDEQYFARALAA